MTTEVKLETLDQRLSYIVGENMAHQLKNDGIVLDTNAFAMAVADVVAGNQPRLSEADKRSAIEEIQQVSEERQKAKHATNIAEGASYLEANGKKDGVTTTDSGLQYKSLATGSGKKPTKSDTVKVHYKGTLIDGTPFDSSYDRGEPAVFPVGGVIAGWTEALQLMNVGDKFELTIPSNLAYGSNGSGQAIGPNATLVFEVELLGIE